MHCSVVAHRSIGKGFIPREDIESVILQAYNGLDEQRVTQAVNSFCSETDVNSSDFLQILGKLDVLRT